MKLKSEYWIAKFENMYDKELVRAASRSPKSPGWKEAQNEIDYRDLRGALRSAIILNVPTSMEAAVEIAGRSRGTPRIANALLRRVRDFAQIKGNGSIDIKIAKFALEALNVDAHGLDEMDNKILSTIIDKFKGGPVGVTTIATAVSESTETVEEVYEPFLIQQGFIMRTPRGREVTELAYKHLGKIKGPTQGGLF